MIGLISETRRRVKTLIAIYLRGFRRVSSTAFIADLSRVSKDIDVGDYAFINERCRIVPKTRIGRYSMLGPGVSIIGGDHVFDEPGNPIIFSGRPPLPSTHIGEDAWIGANAIILAGVCIGRGAVIGAGSVVTRDVPDYEVFCGAPARRVRSRFDCPRQIEIHNAMLDGPLIKGNFAARKAPSRQ